MNHKSGKVPAYCHHKPSGRAVVYIGRQAIYLGSNESHENYGREIARWRSAKTSGIADARSDSKGPLVPATVSELILAYLRHAETYYVDASGQQTKEFVEMKLALRPLRQVHGHAAC